MNETHTTQIQFPSPGQRRRLAVAAIAATLTVATVVAVNLGTSEPRATPRVELRDVMEVPVAALATEVPEIILSDGELQAAIDDFCVTYRNLFDVDPATGERPLPRGCTGAAVPTTGEASVGFALEMGDLLLTPAPR